MRTAVRIVAGLGPKSLAGLLAGCLLAASGFAVEPAGAPLVQVFSNGVVICPTGAFPGWAAAGKEARWDFGLPSAPPTRRFFLEDVPILQTEWEHQGVRYTQRVLVTRLEDGPLDGGGEDAVLVVQIAGESLVQDYTNAAASLALRVNQEAWPLEWRGGLIYRPGRELPHPLAFLDIPSVGLVKTNGLRLEFQGHMPPANTGAMTLWVPRRRLAPGAALDRLVDMDFNETLQRVRDFWRRPETKNIRPPLAWGEPPAAAAGGNRKSLQDAP